MTDDDLLSLTSIRSPRWEHRPEHFRAWESSTVLGTGDEVWNRAGAETLRWGVKTRSGFSVDPATTVARGDQPVIVVRVLGVAVREPVEVVDVVTENDRVGFAYRTLPGHPVHGEEAFIVHREDDAITLTIRSLTGPGDRRRWRLAYPALLVAQRFARRRYLRALRVPPPR